MTPEEIKKIRHSLDLTQGEFAEVVGVNRQTINAWEKGYKFPQSRNRQKMLDLSEPSKTWVWLTTEEIEEIGKIFQEKNKSIQAWGLFATAIEHRSRSKNT